MMNSLWQNLSTLNQAINMQEISLSQQPVADIIIFAWSFFYLKDYLKIYPST